MAARYYQQNIAQYNPLTMEEMMFAPMQMRQRHDLVDQGISEIGTSLGQYNALSQDQPFVQQSIDPVQQELDSLAQELATKGYDQSKMSRLLKLKAQREKLFSPTGDVGIAQSRQQQYTEEAKRLTEEFKDPVIRNYALRQLGQTKGLQRGEDGSIINAGINSPNMVTDVTFSERQKAYNEILKNIQNDKRFAGMNINSLDAQGITNLITEKHLEYKDVNDIFATLLTAIPKEIFASEKQRLLAEGFADEEVDRIFSKPPVDIEQDSKGKITKITYNMENPVIREIAGFSDSRAVMRETVSTKTFTDRSKLAKLEHELKDKVNGYSLPPQVIAVKNPYMEGISNEQDLSRSINDLEKSLANQVVQLRQYGIDPETDPTYLQMRDRKLYLEDIVKKVYEESEAYIPTQKEQEAITNYNVDLMNKYNITSLVDIDNPNYSDFLNELGIEIPKEVREGKRGYTTSDYSVLNNKVKKALYTGKGIPSISSDVHLENYFNNKKDQTTKLFNKVVLESEMRNLSMGFTRETSASSIKSKDDFVKTALPALVLQGADGSVIHGSDQEALKKAGINPETISYTAHSEQPTQDGSYLWKVTVNPVNKEGKPTNEVKSYFVQAPPEFNIEQAIRELESVQTNPMVDIKRIEQSFYSTINKAKAANVNDVPLGPDSKYGTLYLNSDDQGRALLPGYFGLIKFPNGTKSIMKYPWEAFDYIMDASQQ